MLLFCTVHGGTGDLALFLNVLYPDLNGPLSSSRLSSPLFHTILFQVCQGDEIHMVPSSLISTLKPAFQSHLQKRKRSPGHFWSSQKQGVENGLEGLVDLKVFTFSKLGVPFYSVRIFRTSSQGDSISSNPERTDPRR